MTTVDRLNLLSQKNEARLDTFIPTELKNLVVEASENGNMKVSQYVKVALIEKLERDTPEE